ncbi:MAG: NUDIX hydrolase [Desulfobacterales bacterium]|jgi:8-oxo-dGTP diphosphatase
MVKRPLIGVAVIVIKEGRVLLGKRKNAHGSGTWAFPGGHLEFNESIKACARREVFEETGLQIKNLRYGPFTNDVFADEEKHYVTLFVISDYDSGSPVAKEPHKCDKWAWIPWPPDVQPCFLPITNLLKLDFKLPC